MSIEQSSDLDSDFMDERPCRQRIRVLVADDHPMYLRGLRMACEILDGVEVVGEASSGEEAMAAIHRLAPDVAIMDVRMPGLSGIEATKALRGRCQGTAVIILTMIEDDETVRAAFAAGARGYLLKGAGPDEVGGAIQMVSRGGVVFGAQVSCWAVESLTGSRVAIKPFTDLTDREREVLELVASGCGNAAIAKSLSLSIKTVRNYMSRIFVKLRIADRTEAAVLARKAGLGD